MAIELTPITSTSPGDAPDWMPILHVGAAAWGLSEVGFSHSDGGRVQEISGRISVQADNPIDLAAKLDQLEQDLGQIDLDILVTLPDGTGGRVTERAILADDFPLGDIGIDWSIEPQADGATQRWVRFTATGQSPDAGDGGGDEESEALPTVSIETRPDGLSRVESSGTFEGDTAEADYAARKAAFEGTYPSAGGGGDWIYSHSVERSDDGLIVSFTLRAEQLLASYPASAGNAIDDGEISTRIETQHAAGVGDQIVNVSADLLITGSATAIYDVVRAAAVTAGDVVISETMETTAHKEMRLRATFQIRRSASGLLEWEQSIAIDTADAVYEELVFNAANPILKGRDKRFRRLVQSGQAVGHNSFPAPPGPAVAPPDAYLLEKPTPKYDLVGAGEKRTSWQYVLAVQDAFDPSSLIVAMAVPAAPAFVEATP